MKIRLLINGVNEYEIESKQISITRAVNFDYTINEMCKSTLMLRINGGLDIILNRIDSLKIETEAGFKPDNVNNWDLTDVCTVEIYINRKKRIHTVDVFGFDENRKIKCCVQNMSTTRGVVVLNENN